MDRRDTDVGTSVTDKEYTKVELDAMPLDKVMEIYEAKANELANRTEAVKRLIPKRGSKRADQREGANEAKHRLLAQAIAKFEIFKAYVVSRAFLDPLKG